MSEVISFDEASQLEHGVLSIQRGYVPGSTVDILEPQFVEFNARDLRHAVRKLRHHADSTRFGTQGELMAYVGNTYGFSSFFTSKWCNAEWYVAADYRPRGCSMEEFEANCF